MTDKLELQTPQDIAFQKELEKVVWPMLYGSVKIQLREGKPKLIVVERTIKLD